MNFISWATKPTVINENTQNYISDDLVEESIAKTLKPVMNKMKKLNIGLPYRDARLFFFKFLQDNYPEAVPAGFETRKPSAKDVNAIVGQIAIERPELLDTIGDSFEQYSAEKTDSGLDRVSQFLNTAATLRQGKGVRPKKAEGYVTKDYSKLTAQEIANATTDAIAKKQEEFDAGDDVSDEKLLLRTAVGSVIAQLEKEDVSQEALDNVAAAVAKINTLDEFEKFLNYIADFEEYSVIYQYLQDTIDVIETNLGDMQAQKEDEEYNAMAAEDAERCPITGKMRKSSDEEAKPDYLDTDKDGDKEESMKKALEDVVTQKALRSAIKKEEEESLIGKEAVLDHSRPVMVIDHDGDKFVFVQDEDGRELKVPLSRLDFTASSENEEHEQEEVSLEDTNELSHGEYETVQNFQSFNPNEWQEKADGSGWSRKAEDGEYNIEDTPLEELSILSPEEFEEVQNFENFNPNEWGYNTLQKFYFRKREGGEDNEHSTSQYMSKAPVEKREEAEEVKMSRLEINQHLAVQERQRVQNLYAQQRRHTHGY